jgi:predicted glycosyltransferase involved in capsule biosynthesis
MNITFLIPVRLESIDRIENAKICLTHLCKHAPYNIIILENDTEAKIPQILSSINTNKANIKYIFQNDNNLLFHKTKYLNTMLSMATTEVVVNYDIDVLLPNNIYEYAYSQIMTGYDLLYPYFDGESLIEIKKEVKSKVLTNINDIPITSISMKLAKYGLCQFLNRNSYIKYGKMNENFYSYGPEDWELGYRFTKLGLKVGWLKNYIFHLEHSRGINSDKNLNPMAEHNYSLYEKLKQYSCLELQKYYEIID